MSTYQTMQFSVAGEQALSLTKILGPGGCQLMKDTLRGLADRPALLPGEVPGTMNWQRVGLTAANTRQEEWELSIQNEHLPAELRAAGVENFAVRLTLGGAVAEISHSARGTARAAGRASVNASPALQKASQRLANRAVNQVLSVAATNRLTERVQVSASQSLSLRLEQVMMNRTNLRTYAELRAR